MTKAEIEEAKRRIAAMHRKAVQKPAFLPEQLPCGKLVNQNWSQDKEVQCCKTECPNFSDPQIKLCVEHHKAGKTDPLDFCYTGMADPNRKDRLFYH